MKFQPIPISREKRTPDLLEPLDAVSMAEKSD
jgi:hypothetical protein